MNSSVPNTTLISFALKDGDVSPMVYVMRSYPVIITDTTNHSLAIKGRQTTLLSPASHAKMLFPC